MALDEVISLMREQMRSKLESQGINVDQIQTMDDFEKLNLNVEDEYDKLNESRLVLSTTLTLITNVKVN
jgi:hypothetical protein